jgi:hypothetical protein
MPSLRLLAVALFVACAAAAPTASPAAAGCSDARPRTGAGFKVGPTCDAVLAAGDCGKDWMKTTITELPEGYCQVGEREGGRRGGRARARPARRAHTRPPRRPRPRPSSQISCGRCPSCKTLDAALRGAGLAPVADAAASSPRWAAAFKSPATTLTLLAPTHGFGGAGSIDRHIVVSPPAWGNATWTAALLAAADTLPTAAGDTIAVSNGVLAAPGGRASVTRGDVAACKSVIHVLDAAL